MRYLKDLVKMIFGVEESAEISTGSTIAVITIIILIVFMLAISKL